jgi:5,5'-dehydrodivanillate O-demethylase
VAQVGQGRIADRTTENLTRTDKGVLMLRQIWFRELEALKEGTSVKAWVPMTVRHDADLVNAVLRNAGTGARAASLKG